VVLFVSEPLRAASVPGAVHVSQNGQLVPGTVQLTSGGQAIAFTPSAPWTYGALVQVFLDPSAVDVNGTTVTAYQGAFTVVGDPATAALTAIAATPANGASGVPRNTRIRIGYSGPLDVTTASFTTQTVWLTGNTQNPVPAAVTVDATGTVLQFDSDAAFEAFFRSHYHRYESWPRYGHLHTWPSHVDYGDVSSRGFAFPNVFAPLHRFFAANGWLPQLTCPPPLLEWARSFIRQHVSPAVPVAAQIRFNPESPARNTDIEAWKAFFQAMEKRSEVKFIVVCRREEIVPELRSLTNVVYSKDHASSVLEDLALIQVSAFSMFPDAGFPAYPWFCGQPTLFFGKQLHEFPQRRLGDETGTRMPFLSPFQRRRFGPYTAATLEEEFWTLWNDLAAANWKNPHLG